MKRMIKKKLPCFISFCLDGQPNLTKTTHIYHNGKYILWTIPLILFLLY